MPTSAAGLGSGGPRRAGKALLTMLCPSQVPSEVRFLPGYQQEKHGVSEAPNGEQASGRRCGARGGERALPAG